MSEPSFLKKLMTFHGHRNQVHQAFSVVNIIGSQDHNIKKEFGRCICSGHDEDNNPPVVVFNRSLDFLPAREGEEIEVLKVSGDLFLCRHSKKSCRPTRSHLCSSDDEDYYYVCNPITRQWVVLPPRARGHGSDIQFYSSQFYQEDPTTRNMSIYRPEYEYIVLAMVDELPATRDLLSSINVEFFNFFQGRGIWRTLSLSIPQGFYFGHEFWLQESCLHEGVLWYCNGRQLLRYNNINKDLRRHEPLLINLPHDYIFPDISACYIGVSCGRFHLVGQFKDDDDDDDDDDDENDNATYLMVWELDEEEDEGKGGKWRLMHKVWVSDIVIIFFVSIHPSNPDIVFFETCHHLVECNTRTKEFKYHKRAATIHTTSNEFKRQIFFIPPLYPTPVLPLNKEEICFFDPPILPVVTSIWEQVDFFGEFRYKSQDV